MDPELSKTALATNPTNFTESFKPFEQSNEIAKVDLPFGVNITDVSHHVVNVYILFIIAWISFNIPVLRKVPGAKVFVEVVLSNLTLLWLSPILIGLMCTTWLIRLLIAGYFRIFHGGNIKLMTPLNSFYAVNKQIDTNYFLYLQVIEGDLHSLDKVKERLVRGPPNPSSKDMQHIIHDHLWGRRVIKKFGFFCWERVANFNIENHVKYLKNGDDRHIPMNEDKLFQEISLFYDTPMNLSIPQLEIYAVPNYDCEHSRKTGKNCYALLYRIHHAIVDGLSATNSLVNHFLADEPVKLAVDPLVRTNLGLLKWTLIHIKLVIFGARTIFKTLVTRDKNYIHPPAKNIGQKTFAYSKAINIDVLKRTKENTDTTITSIIIAGLGGAVKNFALKKDYPVPKSINTGITVAMLPYENLKPTNRFSMVHLPINLGKSNVSDRLHSSSASAKALAKSVDILVNFYLFQLVGCLPGRLIQLFTESGDCTLILTNSPGPLQIMHFFGGDTLIDFIAWNVIKGTVGLGVTITSYNGRIRAGMFGDKATIRNKTDIPELISEFENEIVQLAEYANVSTQNTFL